MSQRFFLEQPPADGRARLVDAEAHHLAHVMRCKVGDEVTLFDGTGKEYVARIENVGRSDVALAVLSEASVDRELAVPVILGMALPRGDRQAWLVEKLVELGVARLIPLETEHGVAQPTEKAVERLRRGVIEASKQCGRNRLMEIAEPQSWPAFVHDSAHDALRLIAHPGAMPLSQAATGGAPVGGFAFGVGPEGGLTDEEVEITRSAGWQIVSLGNRILRVETAAIVLAVWAGNAGAGR